MRELQQSDKRTDEKFETKRKFVVDAMRVALNITLNRVESSRVATTSAIVRIVYT